MNKQVETYTNTEFGTIRALGAEDGEPWFVASDIAKALGYRMASDMTRRLDDDERDTRSVRTPSGEQQMTVITEAGLYAAILGSKVEGAQRFKRWVTHKVLPSIRKHGGYMAGQESMTPEQMALASMQWLHSKVEEQAKQLEAQAPKVLFADAVNASQTSILVGQLAKIIQQNGVPMGQRRLFAWLREHHYLSSRKGEDYNMPLQKYVEQGLFEIKESTHTNPDGVTFTTRTVKVTGKGQQYFVNKFLAGGLEMAK